MTTSLDPLLEALNQLRLYGCAAHLFTLRFIAEGENVILVGPNGVGKTMILRNLAHRALHDGRSVVVRTASDLLADLAKQESSVARARRLEAYVRPQLLCIAEVGYLSYDVRHADLLFEVVARRHEKKRAIVRTTNKAPLRSGTRRFRTPRASSRSSTASSTAPTSWPRWRELPPPRGGGATEGKGRCQEEAQGASAGLNAPLARRRPITLRGGAQRVARRSPAGKRVARRVSGCRARS